MEELTPQQIAQNWVKWLKALASGEYRKTYSLLHRTVGGEERHCCLGVAQVCLNLGMEDDSFAYGAIARHLGMDLNPYYMSLVMQLNDGLYRADHDFVNMHRELSERLEKLTSSYPEVAPLVRTMMQ